MAEIETAPRLFGTDGVRGTAGRYPLDRPTVRRLGAALVRALHIAAPRFLVGRDTRESGAWIEAELTHGAATANAASRSGNGFAVAALRRPPPPSAAVFIVFRELAGLPSSTRR